MSASHVAVSTEFISAVASEIVFGIDTAVESWMAQIESALDDVHLTTLGRMHAVQEVLTRYKDLTGKTQLQCRSGGREPLPAPSEAGSHGQ